MPAMKEEVHALTRRFIMTFLISAVTFSRSTTLQLLVSGVSDATRLLAGVHSAADLPKAYSSKEVVK